LVYLGRSHSSSRIHEQITAELRNGGPDGQRLQDLRLTAETSRASPQVGGLEALGQPMIDNIEAQRRLHPDLGSNAAQQVRDVAWAFGAFG